MTAAIFIFGVLVFAIVATACGLIAYGIVAERRDRRQLEAEQAAEAAGEEEARGPALPALHTG